MEKLFDYIKLLVMALGTGLTWLLGVWDMPLITLVIFMILDQLTGVIRGYVNKDLSSDVGLKGIARKCVILIVLIVAVSLDRLLNTGSWMFRTMVAYFYIANEGISLLENCASLGAPIPEKLKDALIQLKEGKKKEPINENA
ncbi:phage holin family protein [Clostridium perfringens]|uniref:phage holin family protein n=1 Tax=Clostridium perfringens TaxID=1502 RepID=UPI002245E599|nr:phage holin family protein [Clostridium perfringens]MCX0403682.1 phage holin family protein [Clostridium perfringens]